MKIDLPGAGGGDHHLMLLGLDYELFFGSSTGTVQRCLIDPVDALLKVLGRHGGRLCLFVDAGYLCKLEAESQRYPVLGEELAQVQAHLRALSRAGHDIQLHIHPHWEDCHFDGKQWNIDTTRYRLHDFTADEQLSLVRRYKEALEKLSARPIFAYRAGGWCLQPFSEIARALQGNGIWLDSTVFDKGISEDPVRWFDFKGAPNKSSWRFSADPLQVDEQGEFWEIPISRYTLSPYFYWKMLVSAKLAGRSLLAAYGDGESMRANLNYYITRLTRFVPSPVSIDGIKASMLQPAFRHHLKCRPGGVFNVMGHPKSLSPYSVAKLDAFLRANASVKMITFEDLAYLNDIEGNR